MATSDYIDLSNNAIFTIIVLVSLVLIIGSNAHYNYTDTVGIVIPLFTGMCLDEPCVLPIF